MSMPRVKKCPKASVDPFLSLPYTAAAPPFMILTSVMTLKTECSPPLQKKSIPSSPFLNGVVRKLFFSLSLLHHPSQIPKGKSIIIHGFRKVLEEEKWQGATYVITDAFGGSWIAPEVFLKYLQAAEEGIVHKVDSTVDCLALAHIGYIYGWWGVSASSTVKILKSCGFASSGRFQQIPANSAVEFLQTFSKLNLLSLSEFYFGAQHSYKCM